MLHTNAEFISSGGSF